MKQPTSHSCCTKHVSHVKVSSPESCLWFVIPDGDKILLEPKQYALVTFIIHDTVNEVCDTSSSKVEMLLSASSR